jgi:hypothetical protein
MLQNPLLRRLTLAMAGLLLTAVGHAQQPGTVTMHFTAIVLADKPVNDLFFMSTGGALTSLKAPSYKRSGDYIYIGPTTLTLYRMVQQDGALKPEEAGKALLPAGSKKFLLIIVPAGTGYTLGAVDDGEGALPMGKTRLYNTTPNPLKVTCNSTQIVPLKPFETATVDSKDGGIVINVSLQKDGQWTEVSNNVYLVAKDQKLNLFLVSSYSGSVFKSDVQMFRLMEGNVPAPRGPGTAPQVNKTKAPAAGSSGG